VAGGWWLVAGGWWHHAIALVCVKRKIVINRKSRIKNNTIKHSLQKIINKFT
jgi:hypothetical protein